MKMLPALALAALIARQGDPLAAAKKDLGSAFTSERVEPGILLAMPADEGDAGALKESIRKAVKTFRERALDVPPQDSLLILVFATAESYRAYTSKRYSVPVPQASYYDVPNRRVLLRAEVAAASAVQVSRIFLLADSLGGGAVPPWIASSLSVLDDPDPEPATFDHRAGLLREALRRGTLPRLRTFFSLDLAAFQGPSVLSLNTSLSLKFAEYLEKRGALVKFFGTYRKTFRKDPTGAAAVEAALGGKLEAVEKEFLAHLQALPWLNKAFFLEKARKVFGPDPLIQVDEDLMMAVTGNVEPGTAAQAVEHAKKLREPLIKLLDLKTSGLPVLARLFKDQASFQEYAKVDAPHRQWVGGYFSLDSRWLVLHLEPDSGSLTHEYCHALFEDDLGPLPAWFNEGLAQLFQRYRLEGEVPVGERGPWLGRVRTGLAQNRVADLPDFVNFKGNQFFNPGTVNLNYDVAHALLFYLQEKGALARLYREVKLVKAARPLALPIATCRAALEKALGAKVEKINDDFRTWVASTQD